MPATAGADSFEAIARERSEKFSSGWVTSHGARILRRWEKNLSPWTSVPSGASELLPVLHRIEN